MTLCVALDRLPDAADSIEDIAVKVRPRSQSSGDSSN